MSGMQIKNILSPPVAALYLSVIGATTAVGIFDVVRYSLFGRW